MVLRFQKILRKQEDLHENRGNVFDLTKADLITKGDRQLLDTCAISFRVAVMTNDSKGGSRKPHSRKAETGFSDKNVLEDLSKFSVE